MSTTSSPSRARRIAGRVTVGATLAGLVGALTLGGVAVASSLDERPSEEIPVSLIGSSGTDYDRAASVEAAEEDRAAREAAAGAERIAAEQAAAAEAARIAAEQAAADEAARQAADAEASVDEEPEAGGGEAPSAPVSAPAARVRSRATA